MENNNTINQDTINIAMNIANKTIGFDLLDTKVPNRVEYIIPEEPEHPDNEHWELQHKVNMFSKEKGEEYKWVKREYDDENEYWDAPRIPFDFSLLTDIDIKILQKTKHLTKDGQLHSDLEYYFRGTDHLHMVTGKSTWASLCGRHWVYDKKTCKTKLIIMS